MINNLEECKEEQISKKFDQGVKELNERIGDFLNKLTVNYIVCSNEQDFENFSNFEDYEIYRETLPYKKFHIITVKALGSMERDVSEEMSFLKAKLIEIKAFIINTIASICLPGENAVALNIVFRKIILNLDAKMYAMDHDSWLKQTNAASKDNVYYLLLKNKRKNCRQVDLNFELFGCKPQFDFAFGYRRDFIFQIKELLVNLYSDYLIIPDISEHTKIVHTITKADITAIIYAFINSKEVDDREGLKKALLILFDVSREDFVKNCREVTRRVGPSKFMKNFINLIQPPEK